MKVDTHGIYASDKSFIKNDQGGGGHNQIEWVLFDRYVKITETFHNIGNAYNVGISLLWA